MSFDFVTPQNRDVYYIPEGKDTVKIPITFNYVPDPRPVFTATTLQCRLNRKEWLGPVTSCGREPYSYQFQVTVTAGSHFVEGRMWQFRTGTSDCGHWQMIAQATPVHFTVYKTFNVTIKNNFVGGSVIIDGVMHSNLPTIGVKASWTERSKHKLFAIDSQKVDGYIRIFDRWDKNNSPFVNTPSISLFQIKDSGAVYTAIFRKAFEVTLTEAEYVDTKGSVTYKVNGMTVGRKWSGKILEGSQSPYIIEAIPAMENLLVTGWVDNAGAKHHGNPIILTPTDHVKGLRAVLILKEKASVLRIDNEDGNLLPLCYILAQNYPNPFNSKTIIRYKLPEQTQVSLRVYNILGQKVAELVDETQDVGQYEVEWNAETLEGGVYFYRLTTRDFTSVKKVLLLK